MMTALENSKLDHLQPTTMKMLRSTLLTAAMIVGAGTGSFFAATEMSDADRTLFQDYLVTHQMAAHWEGTPNRIDSAEIRRAYGDRRFYFTFKAAPLPPGAQLPKLIERYEQARREYQKHSLRITLGIDGKKNITAFRSAEDFNVGLMPVKSDDDARVAAAAILSLIGNDHVHPGAINANEINVAKTDSGWTCTVSRPRAFDGKVTFDAAGKCTSAVKSLNYSPPLPP